MKSKMKKLLLTLEFIVLFCCMSMAVSAASKPKLPTSFSVVWEPEYYLEHIEFKGSGIKGKSIKLYNIKYSKKGIANIWANCYGDNPYLGIMWNKPGETVVSFKAKFGNGKTYSYKIRIRVLKYQNPSSTFKIGNKNYSSRFSKRREINVKLNRSTTQKVTIKARSGWELKNVYYNDKRIRNGSRVKLKKGTEIFANFKHKKTGAYDYVSLRFY